MVDLLERQATCALRWVGSSLNRFRSFSTTVCRTQTCSASRHGLLRLQVWLSVIKSKDADSGIVDQPEAVYAEAHRRNTSQKKGTLLIERLRRVDPQEQGDNV